MKIQEYWDCYYEMSGKASEIARSLSLGALALIWLFKLETPSGDRLPPELILPAAFVVSSMLLDFLQYGYLALAWRIYARMLEVHDPDPDKIHVHSPKIPRVAEIIFAAKVIALLVGYAFLVEYLWRRVAQ
jgi:hypothetical protein